MGKERIQIYKLPVGEDHFKDVKANLMLFQVCQDDERLMIGDHLVLQDIDDSSTLSGAIIACLVTYKQRGGSCGIEVCYCVLGLYKRGRISPFCTQTYIR